MKIASMMMLLGAGLIGTMIPNAKAADNQETTFTFSSPVEIPGRVLLPGTYVFRLVDSQTNRDIVQVLNEKENHVYGTFVTTSDYRLNPKDKTVMTFEEREADSPEAVKTWFFPGQNYGHDFVYWTK
ncbi:MAG TPA: hypothetical protein VIH58_04540 [Chthoniobacterales bacterium]